jgi:hypothetical protein
MIIMQLTKQQQRQEIQRNCKATMLYQPEILNELKQDNTSLWVMDVVSTGSQPNELKLYDSQCFKKEVSLFTVLLRSIYEGVQLLI